MANKTVKVIDLVEKANQMLKDSTCGPEGRGGIMTFIESILHETGNYSGFRYLQQNEVPEGHYAGIRYIGKDPSFFGTDNTRVKYYIHERLME